MHSSPPSKVGKCPYLTNSPGGVSCKNERPLQRPFGTHKFVVATWRALPHHHAVVYLFV
jgi:hypothetical protein